MITYEVRNSNPAEASFKRILININERERWNPRSNSVTLWKVEHESKTEAAVRRMKYLEQHFGSQKPDSTGVITLKLHKSDAPLANAIDAACPPPAPKETQLDWNTGEPIRAVKTWQESSGVWIACVSDSSPERLFCSCIVSGKMAVGDSRESAIINLKAIQQTIKS